MKTFLSVLALLLVPVLGLSSEADWDCPNATSQTLHKATNCPCMWGGPCECQNCTCKVCDCVVCPGKTETKITYVKPSNPVVIYPSQPTYYYYYNPPKYYYYQPQTYYYPYQSYSYGSYCGSGG